MNQKIQAATPNPKRYDSTKYQ